MPDLDPDWRLPKNEEQAKALAKADRDSAVLDKPLERIIGNYYAAAGGGDPAFGTGNSGTQYGGTAESRATAVTEITHALAQTGSTVNFADTHNVRDALEQVATGIYAGNAPQKQALNEYLGALQKENITPHQMIAATNKLEAALNENPDWSGPAIHDFSPLSAITYGLGAQHNLNPTTDGGVYDQTVNRITDATNAVKSTLGFKSNP